MDELDRILSSEAQFEPSPELARRVLAAVQRETGARSPIPFPWRRVAAGVALLALASTAAVALPSLRAPTQQVLDSLGALDGLTVGGLLAPLAIVLATLWLAWRND